MKKWTPFILILVSFLGFFFFISQRLLVNTDETVTIEKKAKEIELHPVTVEEGAIHFQAKKGNNRAPASLPTHPYFPDREVIGGHDEFVKRVPSNKINENWRAKLGEDLLRFQPEGTKLVVENERSLVQIKKEESLFVQQVLISYINIDGRNSSFRAYVNSETAEIIQTWDRAIFEDYKKRPLSFHPTGELKTQKE